MGSPGVEFFFSLDLANLDDAPLYDVRRVAFNEAVDHSGASHKPDLSDRQREQRVFTAPVQVAPGVHHPFQGAGMGELTLQLLFVELFALEYLHGFFQAGNGIAILLDLRYGRDLRGRIGPMLQPFGPGEITVAFFSYSHHRDLLELFELLIGKTPDGKVGEIVRKDLADVRSQAVIRDHIDEQAAQHQMRKTLDQESLLMPGPASPLRKNGEIGRIEKQQVKSLAADPAVKEAAHAHAGQARLRFLRPGFIQLHAIGVAVVALGKLAQGLTAAAAGVQQIGDHVLREPDAPEDVPDVLRIGGIVAHPHVVHQSADHRRVHRIRRFRQLFRIAGQRLIYRLIGPAHEFEPGKPLTELSRCCCQGVFLLLQKRKLRLRQSVEDPFLRLLQLQVGILRPLQIRIPVFLHSGSVCQKLAAPLEDRGPGLRQRFQREIAFLLLRQLAHGTLPSEPRADDSSDPHSSFWQAPGG